MKRFWQFLFGLTVPILLWGLFVGILVDTMQFRLQGDEPYDQAALREWVMESRVFRKTLPELVGDYLHSATPQQREERAEAIRDHLRTLGDIHRMYQGQLLLFPNIYHLEVQLIPDEPVALDWDSNVPRRIGQINRASIELIALEGKRAIVHIDYQLHAFDKRQRDEQAAYSRLRLFGILAGAGTVLALLWVLWIFLAQRREREREMKQVVAQQQVEHAERRVLENQLRRQEAEHTREEVERRLLEQQLATQEAESQALELKSQLYANIGIMAGSYAHNIKNLLLRPSDLLRRCLEGDGLSPAQGQMLLEVRHTLGTVTERLQQILRTVRRDPSRSETMRIDLNALIGDLQRTWEELAREKWKLTLTADPCPDPLWTEGDASHLQQAVENLVFNARDATFEMRNHLREEARRDPKLDAAARKQALIDAAAWKGTILLRTRRTDSHAILEIQDNGIGMTDEVRLRCTETHFTTKRDNALYEGYSAGMGLGLSFVVVVLEHHEGSLEIESAPLQGAVFRVRLPLKGAPGA